MRIMTFSKFSSNLFRTCMRSQLQQIYGTQSISYLALSRTYRYGRVEGPEGGFDRSVFVDALSRSGCLGAPWSRFDQPEGLRAEEVDRH